MFNREKQEDEEVVEVYMIDVTELLEKVKSSSEAKIRGLTDIIKSLNSEDDAHKLTIGTLTAQIAQIEMTRETSVGSLNNIQSRGNTLGSSSNDIKIEKQRFCPAWTENLKYEPFKKQLENWNKKNKNDDSSKFYDVLESLKKNDKVSGLSEYIAGTVCEQLKEEDDPTVAKLIKFLDNKYMKTEFERVDDFIEELFDVKNKEE